MLLNIILFLFLENKRLTLKCYARNAPTATRVITACQYLAAFRQSSSRLLAGILYDLLFEYSSSRSSSTIM